MYSWFLSNVDLNWFGPLIFFFNKYLYYVICSWEFMNAEGQLYALVFTIL